MIKLWQQHRNYWIGCLAVAIIGLLPLLLSDKIQVQLLINSWHHPISDLIFRYLTHLGDGWLFVLVIVLMAIFRSYYHALLGATTFALSGIGAQILKRMVFFDAARPKTLLGEQLQYVEGVVVHASYSFPSGHSTTAFALSTFLVIALHKAQYDILWLALAVMVAFSRIYLHQHFLSDVYAGMCLGICTSLLAYWLSLGWWQKPQLQRALRG